MIRIISFLSSYDCKCGLVQVHKYTFNGKDIRQGKGRWLLESENQQAATSNIINLNSTEKVGPTLFPTFSQLKHSPRSLSCFLM